MRTPNNDPELTIHPDGAGQAPLSGAAGQARLPDGPVTARARPPRPQKRSGDDAAERRCILSGDHGPRAALIRLALSPDGLLVPDIQARAPGRGAWIGVDQATLAASMAKGRMKAALARAFKGVAVTVPAGLPGAIAEAFRRNLLSQLGLAAKAGVLLVGAEKIDQTARTGAVALILHASDAADDGRRKRDQSWRVGEDKEGSDLAGVILPVDRTALSVALGRDNVVHVAITDGAWAERINVLLDRWRRFTGSASGSAEIAETHETTTADAPMTGDGTAVV